MDKAIKYDENKKPKEYNGNAIQVKGNVLFYYSGNGIKNCCIDDNTLAAKQVYNMMSGEEFLKCVEEGYIIDYDGTIVDIFVEGYVSNLGLITEGICQGKFLLDTIAFKEICNEFHVMVNWANK